MFAVATATSASAARSRRARPRYHPARSSTASTRPGRSSTPRRRTASPRPARRSSTSRTARSSGCSSTTSRSTLRPRASADYERVARHATGALDREVVWQTPRGAALLVALAPARLARAPPPGGIRYEVTCSTPPSASSSPPSSSHRQRASPAAADDDPRRASGFAEQRARPGAARVGRARASCWTTPRAAAGWRWRAGWTTCVDGSSAPYRPLRRRGDRAQVVVHGRRRARRAAAAHQVPRLPLRRGEPAGELCAARRRARSTARRATGYDAARAEHSASVDEFWERSDMQVDGARPALQQALRFSLFQLLQATARARGPRRSGQGADRPRLRGPLLLGHGDLRPAVPHLHRPAGRAQTC